MKVKEMMTKKPIKVGAKRTIHEAVHIMAEKKLGSLMVYEGDEIVGILEEADIIRNVLGNDLNPDMTKVEKVMSVPFIIDGERSDDQASEMMKQHQVRHLAVSTNSKIVGIVSMLDLIRPVYSGRSFWT